MSGIRGRINGEVGFPYCVLDTNDFKVTLWADMVQTEERKMKEREEAAKEQERRDEASGKVKHHKDKEHHDKKKSQKKD